MNTLVDVPSITFRDNPTNEQIQDALLALWHEMERPSQFGLRVYTDDHSYSFTATPVTKIGNMLHIALMTIGNPRTFSIAMAPLTPMYGSTQQIRNRLRAFALAAIDATDLSAVDAGDLDLDLNPLIDEFLGAG